ncbi:MAG: hypothetical protein M3256_25645 [Actinomycetota bacterium]|nr:hypothetical protein [Actinomycetota bacterium]
MSGGSVVGGVDFYLSQRDYDPPDFDGRLRSCFMVDRLWFRSTTDDLGDGTYLRVRVDPPLPVDLDPQLPLRPSRPLDQLVLQPTRRPDWKASLAGGGCRAIAFSC